MRNFPSESWTALWISKRPTGFSGVTEDYRPAHDTRKRAQRARFPLFGVVGRRHCFFLWRLALMRLRYLCLLIFLRRFFTNEPIEILHNTRWMWRILAAQASNRKLVRHGVAARHSEPLAVRMP